MVSSFHATKSIKKAKFSINHRKCDTHEFLTLKLGIIQSISDHKAHYESVDVKEQSLHFTKYEKYLVRLFDVQTNPGIKPPNTGAAS